MSGVLKAVVIALIVVVLIAGGAAIFVEQYLSSPASDSADVAVFEVRPGETMKSVARRLEDEGLVNHARLFQTYARLSGSAGKVRVGEYAIRRNANPREVLLAITSGKSIEYSLTVTEGLNLFEIAELMERQKIGTRDEFLALVRDRAFIREALGEDLESLEGYLFPETYRYTKFTGLRSLVRGMVERFKSEFEQVPEFEALGLTRHQLVTLASIIEKETGAPEERPLISSVFHNRMKLKMKLQTDPTVVYGIWLKTGSWNRNISRDDLSTPTLYNTYVIPSLPPGPIANPGLAALAAAAQPAVSDYLFFVSKNDGTHVFSASYNQHSKAVSEFQLDRKARQGKSWRDLKKRAPAPGKPAVKTEKTSAVKK